MKKWGIGFGDNGKYMPVAGNGEIESPGGNEICSYNENFIALIAQSLNLYGSAEIAGLTPYGIESSRLDFDLRNTNPKIVEALSSAYDDSRMESDLEREEWLDLVVRANPRTIAALVTLCGNIGWPEIGFDMAARSKMPGIKWCAHICPMKEGFSGLAGIVNQDSIDLFAEDVDEPFGLLVLRNQEVAANCKSCINDESDFSNFRCAIYRQFALVKRYIDLGKAADEADQNKWRVRVENNHSA